MSATENGRPPRMTISRALEMALLNRQARQPSVEIDVKDGKVVGGRAFAAHDDPDEAWRIAWVLTERIVAECDPTEQPTIFDVELARNAKLDTQVKVSAKTAAPELVASEYETLRRRFPAADGTVTNDAPRAK